MKESSISSLFLLSWGRREGMWLSGPRYYSIVMALCFRKQKKESREEREEKEGRKGKEQKEENQ